MELKLDRQELLRGEDILSPEEELEWMGKYKTAADENTVLKEENVELKEENADLKQQLANYKKLIFGQKSEKTEVILENAEQLTVFNEAESEESCREREAEKPVVVAEHTRKSKRTHDEMAAELPAEEIVHPVEDKTCPACGTEMETVGKEFVRDELVYVPARLFVRKHYAEVVKCPNCGADELKDKELPEIAPVVFRKASAPSPMIPHSFCSPELLAHVIYEKYAQAVPLYRQEKDFAAMGVKLSRTTMANWIIYIAKAYAEPVWERMKAGLLSGSVIHADETVVQVLNEPGKKAKSDSRMWVYCAAKSTGRNNILFEYRPTRSGDHAARFLGDYDGYLVCDGYDGYNKLKNVTRCGCWAHVRRKFVEALPTDKALLPASKAAKGVEWCNKLFELERQYENLAAEERQKQRQERSKPVLDGFFTWLETVGPAGGTKLAKAVQYAMNEKKYLYGFLESPDIPIDNNRAENAIRPFVVGRKNWLFSDSVKGAEASAVLYSLAATACANGLNFEKYFTELLSSGKPILPW
jgi:transposase